MGLCILVCVYGFVYKGLFIYGLVNKGLFIWVCAKGFVYNISVVNHTYVPYLPSVQMWET